MNLKARSLRGALLALVGASIAANAQVVPQSSPVRAKSFRHPDLYVPERTETLQQMDPAAAANLRSVLNAFGVADGSIFFDSRTGRVQLADPATATGSGTRRRQQSRVVLGAGAAAATPTLQTEIWNALQAYLTSHQRDLQDRHRRAVRRLRASASTRTAPSSSCTCRASWTEFRCATTRSARRSGTATSSSSASRSGETSTCPGRPRSRRRSPRPRSGHTSVPWRSVDDLRVPRLELIPLAVGDGIDYRLAWVVSVKVDDDAGTWEGLVDAANGTLFAFEDRNQYADGQITGGVYPVSNDQRPPDGVEQAELADALRRLHDRRRQAVHGRAAATSGAFRVPSRPRCPASTSRWRTAAAPSTRPARQRHRPRLRADAYGHGLHRAARAIRRATPSRAARATTSSTGSPSRRGATCPLPDPGGASGSRAAHGQHEHQRQPATPSGTAPPSTSSGPPAQGCRNTGEIAAIFDHEWGHGMDNNGVNPNIALPGRGDRRHLRLRSASTRPASAAAS